MLEQNIVMSVVALIGVAFIVTMHFFYTKAHEAWKARQASKKVELDEITDEEYPLPAEDFPALVRNLRRLRDQSRSPWIKDHYSEVNNLNAVAIMNVLEALLESGKPSTREEVAPTMPASVFHKATRALRSSGLISYDANMHALTYEVNPAHRAVLADLILTDNKMTV